MKEPKQEYPTEIIRGKLVEKQDIVVKIMKSFVRGRQTKIDFESKL